MKRIRRLASVLVISAYAAVLVVPCGGAARPVSETRITSYCECPAHLAHGSAPSTPLELARLASAPAAPLPQPLWTRLVGFVPVLPGEPTLELAPPVPRA